jgi:ribosomal protein L34E
MDNYFTQLNSINVNDKTEQKNGLTYLSWAWSWGEVKKLFPDATYTVYENADGLFYHTDGMTCWVKTGVTVNGIEHIEFLPVMDYKNRSIPREKVTSFDVNKAIQRSLTKAVARHGLGLYIYAGEDLPEGEERPQSEQITCERCNGSLYPVKKRDGTFWEPADMAKYGKRMFGKCLCAACLKAAQKESSNENT